MGLFEPAGKEKRHAPARQIIGSGYMAGLYNEGIFVFDPADSALGKHDF
jgi:hypothetical protein